MKDHQLNALAMMMAHKDFEVDFDKVLNKWSEMKNRNIMLAFDDKNQDEMFCSEQNL